MQIMRIVNEEADRFLIALHHFHQRPFALFGFAGDVAVFFRREIVVQG